MKSLHRKKLGGGTCSLHCLQLLLGKSLLNRVLPCWGFVKSFSPFNTCVSEAEFQQTNLTAPPLQFCVLLILQNVNNAACIHLNSLSSGALLLNIVWSLKISIKILDIVVNLHIASVIWRKLDWLHKSCCKVQTEPKVWVPKSALF